MGAKNIFNGIVAPGMGWSTSQGLEYFAQGTEDVYSGSRTLGAFE